MAKTLVLTLSQFLTLSEAQTKVLVSQGYDFVIGDNAAATLVANSQPKVEAKVSNQPKVERTVSKANKPAKSAKADSKKPEVAFGKIKKNDYFKVVNLETNKVGHVGKANSVSKADGTVTTKGGKIYKLDNCVAITKATYNKLYKSLKSSEAGSPKASTSKRLNAQDYKVVYVAYLAKQGKISEAEVAKAKDNAEYRSELYKQFKTEMPLNNAEALKLFAELSTKVEPAPTNA